ncbi:twin-arginine translocase subunit TatC [Pacificimonas flava]|uniref:Sec-independent protein translocase protein TatC n=2 Tax=Pacificimonas TaxID=1960290 RepID=A0A219B2N5_9SPHN|nr:MULTISPECIES: twin-arginine translocase subunit TatC [Pacificimonas]MBZ6377951.1 twin-arginine translocase subunit TatC [Pacificimonas aurantium]OWV32396.1 twin-arginine translocase subunit TatC [Pacificimonas flava]
MSDSRPDDIDDSRAPLLEHLTELRTRLLWSVAALLLFFFAAFAVSDELLAFLGQPLLEAYDRVGDGTRQTLIYTKLYEAFFTKIKVAFFAAFLFAFPIIANQVWAFVAPGLYKNEKRALLPFLIATPVLFFLGAALAYYIAMPTVFTFLLEMQGETAGVSLQALPAVGDYLSFAMSLIFAFGLCFLVPIALMLVERAGLVTLEQLRGFRRYAIVAAFVIAAIVTPPDVVSQFMLAVPMIVLYELSLVAILITHRRAAKLEREAAE